MRPSVRVVMEAARVPSIQSPINWWNVVLDR
jgi:hypothetical protein